MMIDDIVPIGALQLAILGALWRAERPVRFVQLEARVKEHYKPICRSTFSTTLTKLIDRGWIVRPAPRMYAALLTREALINAVTRPIEEA